MWKWLSLAAALFILSGCLAVSAVKTTGKVAGVAAGTAIGTTGKVVKGTVSLATSGETDENETEHPDQEDVQTNNSLELDA